MFNAGRGQLVVQVILAILLFMLFFGTYLFQVGLIGVLLKEFKILFGAALVYITVTTVMVGVKVVRLQYDENFAVLMQRSKRFNPAAVWRTFGSEPGFASCTPFINLVSVVTLY